MRIRIEGEIGEHPNTAAAIGESLAMARGEPVEVIINSPGGDAFQGTGIYAEFRQHPGTVSIKARGVCASAASLIAMAGDDIAMATGSLMMLHDPRLFMTGWAVAKDLRDRAEALDEMTSAYATVYAEASGNDRDTVLSWMRSELWLTAGHAVALGFADRLEGHVEQEQVAAFDYGRFGNAPAALVAIARREGWAKPEKSLQEENA